MAAFPQAKVETNAEFRKSQEDQINQLLVVITVLLGFSIVIAVLGHLDHDGARRVRADAGDRPDAGRRHDTSARPAARCGGRRSSCRRSAPIVGIVVGTLIGVALSLAVPDTVIDHLAFSPLIIVIILVGAVLAGFVAALYPSYKASNMNVLQAIATE